MAGLTELELTEITRREMRWYAGESINARAYFFADDTNHAYSVNIIRDEPGKNHSIDAGQNR